MFMCYVFVHSFLNFQTTITNYINFTIMGQYRFSFYFKWQFGFLIKYDNYLNLLEFQIPFIQFLVGLDKTAHGCFFFFE